jgi:phosphatidylinositol alpha-1,6-mannosyltransferase
MATTENRGAFRVGILAPCPPPYAGITRVIENHLNFWPQDRVGAYLVPNYPPADPKPFPRAQYVDLLRDAPRSWKGVACYLPCLAHAPLTRTWVYRQFVRYNAALSSLIERERLDVLYAHEVWPAGASAALQQRIHGIASVVVAYGETWHTTTAHARQRRMEPYVLPGASWVISTSEHCRNGALRRGAPPERASVIYAGIDLEKFRPGLDGRAFRARYQVPDDAIVVAALGLTLRRKLDTLLDALDRFSARGRVHCLIGGAGEDLEYVKQRAASIRGVTVQLLGFVSDAELPSFYAATDVLVVSPRTLLECMGQSMKEAMACGRAVVGARIGGVPEAIGHEENGLLFEPDDAADLCKALERLCGDRALRERFGDAGRRIAEQKFNARVAAEQTLAVFEQVVRERPRFLAART